jgi:hypothetical protein
VPGDPCRRSLSPTRVATLWAGPVTPALPRSPTHRGSRSASPRSATTANVSTACSEPGAESRLLVQQLLDAAQRAAQGLRIGPGAAQRQRGLELGSDGIRYGLQRSRCISLRSAALQCARCVINYPKCTGFRNWSVVEHIWFGGETRPEDQSCTIFAFAAGTRMSVLAPHATRTHGRCEGVPVLPVTSRLTKIFRRSMRLIC